MSTPFYIPTFEEAMYHKLVMPPVQFRFIKRFYKRPIHDPAPRLPQSISDLPRSNESNLSITRARFEQLPLNLSIFYSTSLYVNPQ